jgi:hypothetical protein
MKNTIILLAIAGICAGACLLHAADTQDKATQQERVKWVSKCMTELQSVKPGMTRAEVEKKFKMDGGLQGYVTVRYIHPECSYFKIDVKFLVKRNVEDQGRVVPTPKDKALSVSKPYIENPYYD